MLTSIVVFNLYRVIDPGTVFFFVFLFDSDLFYLIASLLTALELSIGHCYFEWYARIHDGDDDTLEIGLH